MTLEQEARRLYARRDRIAQQLAEIDQQLNKLRSQYMHSTSTYGIHPTAFRRQIENSRTAA